MEQVWVSPEADDRTIQRRLNELYSTKEMKQKSETVVQQLMPTHEKERFAVLAVSESSIQIEEEMRQRIRESQQNDDQYSEMMTSLQDPNQDNEQTVNDKVFRIRRGVLSVHERNQLE